MDEDAGELLRIGGQFGVECNAPLADERAGVGCTVPVAQFPADFEPDPSLPIGSLALAEQLFVYFARPIVSLPCSAEFRH
jgi:hypothetical protein